MSINSNLSQLVAMLGQTQTIRRLRLSQNQVSQRGRQSILTNEIRMQLFQQFLHLNQNQNLDSSQMRRQLFNFLSNNELVRARIRHVTPKFLYQEYKRFKAYLQFPI